MERMHFLTCICVVECKKTFPLDAACGDDCWTPPHTFGRSTNFPPAGFQWKLCFRAVETAKGQASCVHTYATDGKKLCLLWVIKTDTLYSHPLYVCMWVSTQVCPSEDNLQPHFSGTFHLLQETGSPLGSELQVGRGAGIRLTGICLSRHH